MAVLSLLLLAYAPGRIFGLDAVIRPRLLAATEKGNTVAGWSSLLT